MEVLIYKTSVKHADDLLQITPALNDIVGLHWHLDLDDCDKVLRIETTDNVNDRVVEALSLNGFSCEELSD